MAVADFEEEIWTLKLVQMDDLNFAVYIGLCFHFGFRLCEHIKLRVDTNHLD